jgi:hypothetical protein
VLVPFYTPVGGLYNNLKESLTMPFEASYGFILVLVLMAVVLLVGARMIGSTQQVPARILKPEY